MTPVWTIDRLKNECRSPPWVNGIIAHGTQNLCLMRPLVEDAFNHNSPGCLLGASESVIVLVTDGVSFDVAESCWSPSTLGALTSVFPSTSSTAILSAVTGLVPEDHGVIGVVFYVPEVDSVFDCLRDAVLPGLVGRDLTGGYNELTLGPWPTVFTALRERVDCVAHIGALATVPGRWSRALVNGARVFEPSIDWNKISEDPVAMVRTVIAEIDATLSSRRSRPLLAWAHVNIDSAIHTRGYDLAVHDAVGELGGAAERWASKGVTVVAHSDHGLVEIRSTERTRRLLALLRDSRYCKQPSGGAGRVIWAYPREGAKDDLLRQVRELAGDFSAVIERDELFRSGAIADTQLTRTRIGEIVFLPTGPEFPLLAPNHRFEHGAFSEREMIVPVAIWLGR